MDMTRIWKNPSKALKWLLILNIVGDLISIPFWVALPSMVTAQSQSTLAVDANIAIIDAAIPAALFAIALYGLMKKYTWAPVSAIILTIAQRAIGFYIFKLNLGVTIEIIWSLLIIYFAYAVHQLLKKPT